MSVHSWSQVYSANVLRAACARTAQVATYGGRKRRPAAYVVVRTACKSAYDGAFSGSLAFFRAFILRRRKGYRTHV